jgi:hypothetical protein
MTEKEKIEKATAEGFLELYNGHFNTTFSIFELGDAPDIKCRDNEGNELNIEVTLTEDNPRDIQASLGRSEHKSLEALKKHNQNVAAGLEKPQFSSLSGNVLEQVAKRINEKLLKRYGANTALVVRDTSGVDWEWDTVIDELIGKINIKNNPFNMGIWILNLAKTTLYKVE